MVPFWYLKVVGVHTLLKAFAKIFAAFFILRHGLLKKLSALFGTLCNTRSA